MYKWLIVSVNFLITLLVGSFFDGEVNLQINSPQVVTAGDEFQVTVKLNKGKLESFSRLLQELPAGLKATSVNSANADFTFKDNKVRLIWLKMPDSDSVTISYTIKVDPRLKGSFSLPGKFSYIDNNERMTIEAEPVNITINPNPNIDPNLIVDINDFKEQVIPEITPGSEMDIACFRQKALATGDADGSYIVNLLVYKENAQKFAKIEELVPAGYTAIKIENKEGIFVFKNGMAKYLWMNLPSAPFFMVSYRLVPNAGVTTPPAIKGQFSYVLDEKTVVKDIIEKDLQLASLSASEIKQMIAESRAGKVEVPMAELLPAKKDTEQVIAVQVEPEEKPVQQVQPEQPVEEKKPLPQPKPKFKYKKYEDLNMAYKLEPEEGVYFRVQVAAGHRPVNIKRYFKKFKIADEVRTEDHEGWHKYSIGSFAEYRQARDYRVHIWNTTTVTGAFVSAYNSGQRITVQEALMISNQKWYR
jgi:hypothetical protein